jgi:uncharacterized membrane protein SirB2
MTAFYGEIRLVHIVAVVASGSLFLIRGLLVQAGRPGWALASGTRRVSIAIDTVLLAAALALVTILPRTAFANGWLTAKLGLLPLYVAFGWGALRAATPFRRRLCLAAALAAFAAMVTIARAHDPFGPVRTLLGS